MVKRLYKLPKNVIKVQSDDQEAPSYELDLSDEALDFDVIGRVVWGDRRF